MTFIATFQDFLQKPHRCNG